MGHNVWPVSIEETIMPLQTAADYRRFHKNISGSRTFTNTGDDTTLVATPTDTKESIFIQRIIGYITTDAAQSISFTDTSATVKLGEITTSPGDETRWDFDYGDEGIPLTVAEAFIMNHSATGLAGSVKWYGYKRRTAVGAP
jgi:hypothetical protein